MTPVLAKLSSGAPVAVKTSLSSGDVKRSSSSLFKAPSCSIFPICFGFVYFVIACSGDLNNQPFFNPICAIISMPFKEALEALASATVNKTCDLKSFS